MKKKGIKKLMSDWKYAEIVETKKEQMTSCIYSSEDQKIRMRDKTK